MNYCSEFLNAVFFKDRLFINLIYYNLHFDALIINFYILGTFGRVFKGTYSGLQVAIKKIPKKFSKNGEFEHEVKMLK